VRKAQTQAAIVNLSSAAGIRGVPNRLPYAASKYGVVGITQTMALELGPLGVRVNTVVPEVAVRTAQRWVEEYRASGEVTPRKMGNPSPPKLAAHRELVREVLGAEPDITIEGLRHALAEREIVIGYGSIRRFFVREGITRKKDADSGRARSARYPGRRSAWLSLRDSDEPTSTSTGAHRVP
jgi:transposase